MCMRMSVELVESSQLITHNFFEFGSIAFNCKENKNSESSVRVKCESVLGLVG